jgi:hypothetical protein
MTTGTKEAITSACQQTFTLLWHKSKADFQLRLNSTLVHIFGDSEAQSYTLFFVIPPSGVGSFHIQLTQI